MDFIAAGRLERLALQIEVLFIRGEASITDFYARILNDLFEQVQAVQIQVVVSYPLK